MLEPKYLPNGEINPFHELDNKDTIIENLRNKPTYELQAMEKDLIKSHPCKEFADLYSFVLVRVSKILKLRKE